MSGKGTEYSGHKETMILPDYLTAYTLQDSLRSPACDLGDGAGTQASPSVLLQTLEALALSVPAYCCFQTWTLGPALQILVTACLDFSLLSGDIRGCTKRSLALG